MNGNPKKLALILASTVLFLLGSAFVVLGVEHAAGTFTRIGVRDPVTAWAMVGALVGAYFGLIVGRARTGRRLAFHWAGLGAIVLITGLAFPTLRDGLAAMPEPEPTRQGPSVLYQARVTASSLNLREGPAGRILSSLPCGSEVEVLAKRRARGMEWLSIRHQESGQRGVVAARWTQPASKPAPDCEGVGDSHQTKVYEADEVEKPPRLIGGESSLQAAIRYPRRAKEEGFEGTVFVRFIVDTQGRVQSPEVAGSPYKVLNAEALRVVESMEYEPGYADGRRVPVRTVQKVRFELP